MANDSRMPFMKRCTREGFAADFEADDAGARRGSAREGLNVRVWFIRRRMAI